MSKKFQDVIEGIAATLSEADGEYVANIYNQICSDKIMYSGQEQLFYPLEVAATDGFTTILQHRIKWFLRGEGAPAELDECSIDHIEKLIKDGYNQGELCLLGADGNTDYRGWWSIEKEC